MHIDGRYPAIPTASPIYQRLGLPCGPFQDIQTIPQLYDFLCHQAEDPDSPWFEKAVPGSRQGLLRRLGQVRAQVAELVGPTEAPFQCCHALTVVDLHHLTDRARAFVLANCATLVSGRLEASESTSDAYSWLPPSLRERSTLLAPGSMILRQPQWPMPLPLRFPFPAWATRAEEATAP